LKEVKKVPGKNIYLVKGDLVIEGAWNDYDISMSQIMTTNHKTAYATPFTIVQTEGNTTIVGNLDYNMMLLTK
jgi:hypothetical protein